VTEGYHVQLALFKNKSQKYETQNKKWMQIGEIIGYYMKKIANKSANMLFLCNSFSDS